MATYSDEAWSSPESDLDVGDFCRVCLIDYNEGEKVKARCKLPIRKTPGGPINKAALRNAAGRIFQMTGVPAEAKRRAAKTLVGYMRSAGITVTSNSLLRLAGMKVNGK